MIVQERNSLFVINYVCIVCPFVYSMPVPVYILLKSFTFCRNYIYASIICRSSAVRICKLFFMKRKRNNWKWSFVVFSKWTDQLAQLFLHFKLKVFYNLFFFSVVHTCTCTYEALYNWPTCQIMFVVILKDLNLPLMHALLSTCELCWSQFIFCN